MKLNRNTTGLLFLGIETVLFGLVYFFLVFEEMISIFAVLSAMVLLSIAINRFASLNRIVQEGFSHWKIPCIAYGILFVLGMPFLLRDKPYHIFILFNAGLFAVLGLGLNWQIGSTNIVNFASAASFAAGAYAAALLAVHTGLSFWILLPSLLIFSLADLNCAKRDLTRQKIKMWTLGPFVSSLLS